MKLLLKKEKIHDETLIDRFSPNRAQRPFLESQKRITAFLAANKIGKTTAGAIKMLKYILKEPKVFRVIASLGFEKGVKDIIVPEIKKWLPKSRLIKEKPNSQGVTTKMYVRTDDGGTSIISFMSGIQDEMTFEGDIIDGAWIDEPCPEELYVATLRGLIVTNGPLWFTLTPLTEPWIYNKIFLAEDKDIECFQGSMQDALIEHGGHLTQSQIDFFASKVPEDERPARLFGEFKHLMNRVYKGFDKKIHVVPKFVIPDFWPVYCAIDPHQRKPHGALWLAISPEENWYVCNEVYLAAGIEDFAKEVAEISNQYNTVCHLIDTSAETADWNRRETARSIINKVFKPYGFNCRLARKKNQKKPARYIINQALEGKDDTGIPWLYVFQTCKRTQHEFMNHVWDDPVGTDSKETKEEVLKINDDLLNPLEYIVVEKPKFAKPQILDRWNHGKEEEDDESDERPRLYQY